MSDTTGYDDRLEADIANYLREHPEAESFLEAHEPDNGGERG